MAVTVLLVILFSPMLRGGAESAAKQVLSFNIAEACLLNANGTQDQLKISLAGPDAEGRIRAESLVRYTLILPRGESKKLTARLGDDGGLPPGCVFKLQAIPSGRKNEGVGLGPVVLTADPLAVLSEIGSCATGIGASDGTRFLLTVESVPSSIPPGGEPKRAVIIILALD